MMSVNNHHGILHVITKLLFYQLLPLSRLNNSVGCFCFQVSNILVKGSTRADHIGQLAIHAYGLVSCLQTKLSVGVSPATFRLLLGRFLSS